MIEFKKAISDEEIKEISSLADEIWNEHYIKILSQEQIDYMLEKFQSESALKEQIKKGYEYYLISDENTTCGFFGFCLEKDFLFLSKIYLKCEKRGKGLGRKSIEFVEKYAKDHELSKIQLTVNKYNMTSIFIYNNLGFTKTNDVITDIGNGFVMDDFVMEKTLN